MFLLATGALLAVAASVATLGGLHRSAGEWVTHSRTVTRIARELRVTTLEWDRAIRETAAPIPSTAPTAMSLRRQAYALADSLRRLTVDNPAQRAAALAIVAAVRRWDASMVAPHAPIAARAAAVAQGQQTRDARFQDAARAEAEFLATEERLYAERLVRKQRWESAMLATVLAELAVPSALLLRLRRRLVAEARREFDQRTQLEDQAVEVEEANQALSTALADASLARGVTESIVREQRALIRALPDAVLVFDRSGHLLKVEPTARPPLSRPPEEMIGRSLHELLPQDTADRCLDAIQAALDGEQLVEVEYEVAHPDRVVSWAATASPMSRGVVVWVARDVTQQRVREAQHRQSQKLEAIGQLAGGVAHDFNNMLTAVRAYAQLALDSVDPASEVGDDLREIDQAATRAAALTRQLLAFSRSQRLQPRVAALGDIVGGIESMLRLLVAEVRLRVEIGVDPALVSVDPGQIEQVVLNLAVNARDAMPEGGALTITTGAVVLDAPKYHGSTVVPPGDYATLTVADQGTGMTAETMARIFEPFFTTKEVGRGMGLGLPTVYGIVQQLGGHIAVESVVGAGTAFTLYFPHLAPAEDDADAPATVAPRSPSARPSRAHRILLVEDESSIRTTLARALRGAGYEVQTAPNGEVALENLAATTVAFDLVVTDLVMPVLGGTALGERIATRAPTLPILYVSGHSDEAVRDRLVAAGASYLEKPFGPARLVEEVDRMIRGATRGPSAPSTV